MYNKPTSLIEFILEDQRKVKDAKGNFTLLLTQLEYATKIIASHVRKAGLVDILGKTGATNVYQDEVQKIDEFSNNLLVETLLSTDQVFAVASEELEEPIYSKNKQGEYVVFFDPLDGSSNMDVNISIGTIFSIYHKSDSLLQPGNKQVAAGYALYGSSDMFVYSCGHGVNGFTLDPQIGSFLLSHPDIKIPKIGNIYSVNESNSLYWEKGMQEYVQSLKTQEKPYKARYIASMVADVHRTLLKGGIFLYPADKKTPQGKLRLMYEVNPMSYVIMQAGGRAVSSAGNPLDIVPTSLHQKTPIVLGSPQDVETYQSFIKP